MSNGLGYAVLAIATGITGVAIVAVLVSRKSATADVISAIGGAYAAALKEAVSPITAG